MGLAGKKDWLCGVGTQVAHREIFSSQRERLELEGNTSFDIVYASLRRSKTQIRSDEGKIA